MILLNHKEDSIVYRKLFIFSEISESLLSHSRFQECKTAERMMLMSLINQEGVENKANYTIPSEPEPFFGDNSEENPDFFLSEEENNIENRYEGE